MVSQGQGDSVTSEFINLPSLNTPWDHTQFPLMFYASNAVSSLFATINNLFVNFVSYDMFCLSRWQICKGVYEHVQFYRYLNWGLIKHITHPIISCAK